MNVPSSIAYRLIRLIIINLPASVLSWVVSKATRVALWALLLSRVLDQLFFLNRYYRINDLIWQDGFLIDFLQKKVIDKWTRSFVIYSGYIFSERLLFDIVVRFYIDFVVWPGHSVSIYEFNSVAPTLVNTLFLLISFLLIFSLYYIALIAF